MGIIAAVRNYSRTAFGGNRVARVPATTRCFCSLPRGRSRSTVTSSDIPTDQRFPHIRTPWPKAVIIALTSF